MKKLQCSTKQRSAQTGFTLMEVMVVIVILGILATLVVPMFWYLFF